MVDVLDVSGIPFQEFWHMQMHQPHLSWNAHDVRKILERYGFIGLADWEKGTAQIGNFLNTMRINDIVAVRKGKQLIALTQVIGAAYDIRKDRSLCIAKKEDNLVSWIIYRRPVKILDWAHGGFMEIPIKLPELRLTLKKCGAGSRIVMDWYEKVEEPLRAKGGVVLV
ncbi:pyruvate kinase [Helicobacter suis]|uniref:pyruvate kinase n=1 Tax=Helicobacter suis TaxID=104628 RepID=UPI001F08341E|nr:pyruvate kinase [Helicobacter suis]